VVTTGKAIEKMNLHLETSSRFEQAINESVEAARSARDEESEWCSDEQLYEKMKERDVADSMAETPFQQNRVHHAHTGVDEVTGDASNESPVQPSCIKSELGGMVHCSDVEGNTVNTESTSAGGSIFDRFGHIFPGACIVPKLGCVAPCVSGLQISSEEEIFSTIDKTIEAREIAMPCDKALPEHSEEMDKVIKLVFKAPRPAKDAMHEVTEKPTSSTPIEDWKPLASFSKNFCQAMRNRKSHRHVPIRSVEYFRPGKMMKSSETIKPSADFDTSHQTNQLDAIKSSDQSSINSGESDASKRSSDYDDISELTGWKEVEESSDEDELIESKNNRKKSRDLKGSVESPTDSILQDLTNLRKFIASVRTRRSRDEHKQAKKTSRPTKQIYSMQADIVKAEEFDVANALANAETTLEKNSTDSTWQPFSPVADERSKDPFLEQKTFAENWETFGNPFPNAAFSVCM
jgi:hypothetical protein